MDAISREFRLASRADLKPARLSDWAFNFDAWLMTHKESRLCFAVCVTDEAEDGAAVTEPTDYIAALVHVCDGATVPPAAELERLAKEAISAAILAVETFCGAPGEAEPETDEPDADFEAFCDLANAEIADEQTFNPAWWTELRGGSGAARLAAVVRRVETMREVVQQDETKLPLASLALASLLDGATPAEAEAIARAFAGRAKPQSPRPSGPALG